MSKRIQNYSSNEKCYISSNSLLILSLLENILHVSQHRLLQNTQIHRKWKKHWQMHHTKQWKGMNA